MQIPGKILILLVLTAISGTAALASLNAADPVQQKQLLRWPDGKIQIAISTSLGKQNPNIQYDSDVTGAIQRSVETWRKAAGVDIETVSTEKQSISPAGPRGDATSIVTIAATSENALFFSGGLEESPAATRVFYDKRGNVTEADVALNPFQQFSTDGTIGTFDLESTLTHEIGHVLGLEHSYNVGSTMYERYGRNGAYGLPGFSARSLSDDDVAAVRRLYGNAEDSAEIAGRISTGDTKTRAFEVWAEEARTGRVKAVAVTGAGGQFEISGLTGGAYKIYAQNIDGREGGYSTVGEINAAAGRSVSLPKKISIVKPTFSLDFLGFNGQLSNAAVVLARGKTYTIFLGGSNLNPERVAVGFTSKFLTVEAGSAQNINFAEDISVISVDIRVDPRTPAGDYSIYVAGPAGQRRYIIGGISVEDSVVF